jgi:hypothetical protein
MSDESMRVFTPEAGEIPVRSQRVAAIIKFLVNNERRVGSISRGKLMFSFAGATSLQVDVVDHTDLTPR